MHRLNGLYAQRFNERHGRKGHLFEERFACWVISDEDHLRRAIGYVLENPVKAGLCDDVRDWLWSWSRYAVPPRAAEPHGLSLGNARTATASAAGRRATRGRAEGGRRAPRAARGRRPPASARCLRSGSGR
jgi:hypothetical protein